MIDLKKLRADPDRFKRGAREKGIEVDIDRLLKIDTQRRRLLADQEATRAEQKKLGREIGPQIGKFKRQLEKATGAERDAIEDNIRRLEERPMESSYAVRTDDRSVKISFAAGGEGRAFPTALASCLAKYLRELMLQLLNRWFCERLPGLRPTAGYYTDGRRFLREIAPVLDAEGFPRTLLVRAR